MIDVSHIINQILQLDITFNLKVLKGILGVHLVNAHDSKLVFMKREFSM